LSLPGGVGGCADDRDRGKKATKVRAAPVARMLPSLARI